MTCVLGLDPSLSSFGAARAEEGKVELARWRLKCTGHLRLQRLEDEVARLAEGADLAVVEGLAFAAKSGSVTDLAGLHWLVCHRLWKLGVSYIVVTPSTRAKWLTGRGNAGKDECLAAAIKRFPMADIMGNDEADALTLAAIGRAWLGKPLVSMPQDRAKLLSSLELVHPREPAH